MGSREGIATSHVWEPPPPPPPLIARAASTIGGVLLQLLLLLPLLLLFKKNRCSGAWTLWAPVALTVCLAGGFVYVAAGAEQDILLALCAYAVGLGAVWLLTPYLKGRRAVWTFLKTFLALAGFSVLAFCPRLLGQSQGWFDVRPFLVAALAVAALPGALALVVAGRLVRRRFGGLRWMAWVALWLFVGWNLCALPIWLITTGTVEIAQYLGATVLAWGLSLGLMLPFLLCALFIPFYRARLRRFLDVPESVEAVPPPVPAGMAF